MVVDPIKRRDYAVSRKRIFGWLLRGVGRLATVLGALCFVWMLSKNIIGTLIVLLVCIGGLKLQLLGRRLSIRNAQVFLEQDHRPPVVYLRPFSSDAETTRFREPDIVWNILFPRGSALGFVGLGLFRAIALLPRLLLAAPRTEEDEIASALKRIGPAVAFSDPDPLSLPPVGFPRLKLDPSCWHDEVAGLMKRARLVVLRCGRASEAGDDYWPRDKSDTVSGALGWEIKTALDCVSPERLILFSAFDGLGYLRFCDRTTAIFPKGLPTWIESHPLTTTVRSIIWFDQNWNATLMPVTWVDTAWRLDSLHPFAKSLSEKLFSILRVQPTVADRLALIAKRILATVIDYAFIYTAFSLLVGVTLVPLLGPDSPLVKEALHNPLNLLLLVCVGIVIVVYEAALWSSSLMTSFGKKLFGLVVVTSATKRLTFVQALRRSFFKLILILVTWGLLLNGSGQTVHDRITTSIVTNRMIRSNEPPRLLFTITGSLLWIVFLLVFLALWLSIAHKAGT